MTDQRSLSEFPAPVLASTNGEIRSTVEEGGARLVSGELVAAVSAAAAEEQFKQLYERYYRTVYGFFVNRSFSQEDAHDLAAETFYQAFSSLDRFRGDAKFSTWLFSIMANIWRSSLRRSRRKAVSGEVVSFEDVQSAGEFESGPTASADAVAAEPLERVLEKERSELVRAAIHELPAVMRQCLLLRLDQGLRYREIASVLQISTDQVRSQLQQARLRLRRELGDHFDV